MSSGLFEKLDRTLLAADELAMGILNKIPDNELVRIKIWRPRNIRHHRKFWKLMSIVHENIDSRLAMIYPTVESMVDYVKIMTGHRRTVFNPDGTIKAVAPQSISFHKMDQNEFDVFYDQALNIVAENIIPGIEKESLRQEVLSAMN